VGLQTRAGRPRPGASLTGVGFANEQQADVDAGRRPVWEDYLALGETACAANPNRPFTKQGWGQAFSLPDLCRELPGSPERRLCRNYCVRSCSGLAIWMWVVSDRRKARSRVTCGRWTPFP